MTFEINLIIKIDGIDSVCPEEEKKTTELKPCPFCGMTVHWDDSDGIIHDKVVANCIVDLVKPLDANSNLSKEFWIKSWNQRVSE